MLNPDWTYNYLTGAQSAVDLQAKIPDDDKDAIISVASVGSSDEAEEVHIETSSVYTSLFRCVASNAIDGFLIGAATAGVFSVFPMLIRGKLVKAAKAPFNRGNLKLAVFFSILLSVYNTGRFRVRTHRGGNKRQLTSRLLRAGVAMCVGCSSSLLSNRVRRFVALFLLSRSLETKGKEIYRNLSVEDQEKLEPFVDKADVALATLSMSINGASWIMAPELLDPSYRRFLNSTSGYSQDVIESTPLLFHKKIKVSRLCEVMHPHANSGCVIAVSKFAINQYFKDSLRFYYKLYLIPLLITTIRKKKLSITALKYFIERTGRSALFLTSGGVAMTSTFCIFDKLGLQANPLLAMVSGASSGALVFIEQKTRRLELGLYLFTQAMHVTAAFYARRGWWYPPGSDLIAVAIGFYNVISAYEDSVTDSDPDSGGTLLRPFYISTLKKIFDYEESVLDQKLRVVREDRLHSWSLTKYIFRYNIS